MRIHNLFPVLAACLSLILGDGARAAHAAPAFRPPAVPLVAHDPYFSIWSPADKLTDADTVHWTGRPHRLTSLVRIDGQAFRLMGSSPTNVPALPQTSLEVLPTRTIYTFEGEGVRLTLTFMTPALPGDLMIYSRPVTYLTWRAQSTDGSIRKLALYFDASAELAVNEPNETVAWPSYLPATARGDLWINGEALFSAEKLQVLKLGAQSQPVLAKKGDDLRIDWGSLYLGASANALEDVACTSPRLARDGFLSVGQALEVSTRPFPPVKAGSIVQAAMFKNFEATSTPISRWLMLAYDDEFSIQYFKHNLRPYWRRDGDDAAALLKKAAADYERLKQRCEQFDAELMTDLRRAGGEKYAQLCALAYRQCVAANKLVADANGQPLLFPKENFSNGCIGTMDVIYPQAPQFLLFSPSLTRAMLVPLLDYAASPRWKFSFAPHDLGTYPLANGQVYGGGERTEDNQMPVEETGNALLLLAALAQVEGNADFCAKYWPMLERWADYLKAKGFDPENQLCTDDFAGHLAHNVNLSAKAICGLAAFGWLCALRGDNAKAAEYTKLAKAFSAKWVQEAAAGDHTKLAFDKPETWSQKYNAVWDRLLGFGLFPADVWRRDMDFFRNHQNRFGLPLDSRQDYTKLDWTLWTATLTLNRADFEALAAPVHRFLNETPDRVPMTDWYDAKTGKMVGFRARSVVGGVFLQMLYDRNVWRKWAARDTTRAANWAPLPKPPVMKPVIPTSQDEPATWRYTFTRPANGWMRPDFDDSRWMEGPAGFGTRGTPGAVVRTEWNTPDIWLRRTCDAALPSTGELRLLLHHDEDAEVYVNGVLAAKVSGYTTGYDEVPIRPAARAALKPDGNVLAAHCHQTGGGQYIDVGLVSVQEQD